MVDSPTSQPAGDAASASGVTAHLAPSQFARVRRLAHEHFGLSIPETKLVLVSNRLIQLLRNSACTDLEELIRHYEKVQHPVDLLPLFDCLSTNLTMFFREADHFELLRNEILEPLRSAPEPRRLRLWSAGCSRGCEPYSLAMLVRDTLADVSGLDARILATDLAQSELRAAQRGIYPLEMVRDLDPDLVRRHFQIGRHRNVPSVRIRPETAALVTFGLLNLMDAWKLTGPFDAIFCRNVMIYFDENTREELIRRFTGLLRPGGVLFLGFSESLAREHASLVRVAPSAYRKE